MPEKPSTVDEVLKQYTYGEGQGIEVRITATTAPLETAHMRTVVTTLKSGCLDLRYAPQEPKQSGADTTS
jgi:hypothetical protein